MTSKLENFTTNYFLTRALFLGIGFSLIINHTKQDSIIAFIIGALIGLLGIFLIDKIQEYKDDKTLNELLKEMGLLGLILKIIFIIFSLVLLCEGLTFIQLFATSFFLIKSPIYFISLPLVILLIYIAKGGITTTFRVSLCLFPISAFLTITSLIVLFGYAKFDNITPFFVSNPTSFLTSVFYYTSLSITPSIFMLITKKSKGVSSYIFSSLTLIIKMYLLMAIIGPVLTSIYRFPEYIILKEIKVFNFIEKIENIVALSWVFDIFVYLSMASLFIKELLPKKGNQIVHTFLILSIFLISFLVVGKYFTNEANFYHILPTFTCLVFLITIPTLFLYLLKTKKF